MLGDSTAVCRTDIREAVTWQRVCLELYTVELQPPRPDRPTALTIMTVTVHAFLSRRKIVNSEIKVNDNIGLHLKLAHTQLSLSHAKPVSLGKRS